MSKMGSEQFTENLYDFITITVTVTTITLKEILAQLKYIVFSQYKSIQ